MENSPTPSRAVYGFVLNLLSWVALAIYLAWAYVPDIWFHSVGIYFIPHKHWAITLPMLFLSTFVITFYAIYPFVNYSSILPYNSLNNITDLHSKFEDTLFDVGTIFESNDAERMCNDKPIQPLSDINISIVNSVLYNC